MIHRMNKILSGVVIFLILVAFLGIAFISGSMESPHTCESVCSECGKCTDAECTETACADKCQGHQVTPPVHICESKCAECGKCTDSACTESACADKCQGHQVTPPVHTCEHICSECGKCTDLVCTESACTEKCDGHNSTDSDYSYLTFELNLMSFNIRTISSSDTGNKAWDNRKAAVVSFVNASGADIIGFQEVRQAQFDYMSANASSNYTYLYFPRESGSNPEGLAFAYDNTKFTFVSSEKYWLSPTPETQSKGWGEEYYRIAVVLILKHNERGELVKSINTHGPLVDTANVNAYQLIMDRSVNDGDHFTFLCGDFNAHPDEIGYIPVAEELQDCRVTADDKTESAYTTFNSWGGYTNDNPQIIDFCFVSKGDHVNVKTYDVRQDTWGSGDLLSDHYAVQTVVEVSYKAEIPSQGGNGFDGELDTGR